MGAGETDQVIDGWPVIAAAYWTPAGGGYQLHLLPNDPLVNDEVLLSVRDSDGWYESTRNTIYELTRLVVGSPLSRAVFALVGLFLPGGLGTIRMVDEIVWQGTFDGRFEDRDHAIGVFERWNEEVRQRVPPDRLLVYEVKQGWRPLCEFLGVEEPEEPFPRPVVDQIGSRLSGDGGARAHHLGIVPEELHRDRVLVGVDPHQLAQGALVAVVQPEAGDHLRDGESRPMPLRLQADEPVADPGQRRQQDAVGDAEAADLEGVGEGGLGFRRSAHG